MIGKIYRYFAYSPCTETSFDGIFKLHRDYRCDSGQDDWVTRHKKRKTALAGQLTLKRQCFRSFSLTLGVKTDYPKAAGHKIHARRDLQPEFKAEFIDKVAVS